MNVSSTYLSNYNGFSEVDPNAISFNYFMDMLAITGDNGDHKASPFCRYGILTNKKKENRKTENM